MAEPAPRAHAPKSKRSSARVIIQARDVALLELVLTFRLATLSDLLPHLTAHFPSAFVLWRRAVLLSHFHYLARPSQHELRVFKKRGNPAHVFALGSAGAALLREHGYDLPRVDFDQKAKAWRAHTLDHAIAATHVLSAMLLGVARSSTLERLAFFADGDFTDTTIAYENGKSVEVPIRPDATLSLRDVTTDDRVALFIEIDRGTEHTKRSTLLRSSYYKKVLAYLAYFHEPHRFESVLHASTFVVLTITETTERATALRELVLKTERAAANVFWFTTLDNFTLHDPTLTLNGHVWTTADGKEGALFF